VEWWVTVDRPPADQAETTVTVKSANRPLVTERYRGDAVIPAFQPHEIRRSGYRWAESAFGQPAVRPYITMEALGEPVKSPAVSDGVSTVAYQAALSPGRILAISPQGQARLYNGFLLPVTEVGKPDDSDPTGFMPFSEGYTVAGKYIGLPVGEVKRLCVTVQGKAEGGTNAQAFVQFVTKDGYKDLPVIRGGFDAEWKQISGELDVPPEALRLERLYLYRAPAQGKIWYGRVWITAADLDPAGVDVTAFLQGTALTVPGGSFRVMTYTDEGLPSARPKIRIQLWREEPKSP
jgi:hypothetical protein